MGEPTPAVIRFDPHVHTAAAYDCSTSLVDVLAAASDAGLDAIAVTDHDAIEASLRAVERAPAHGLRAVPGVEVSTADGHLLALFVTERPPVGASLSDTVAWVHDHDGLAVVPHPFQRSRHGVARRRVEGVPVDGIETFNAHALTGLANRRAARYASGGDHTAVGASDAHVADAVGRAYSRLFPPASGDDSLRAALEAGAAEPAGRGASIREYLGKYVRQLARRPAGVARRRSSPTRRS